MKLSGRSWLETGIDWWERKKLKQWAAEGRLKPDGTLMVGLKARRGRPRKNHYTIAEIECMTACREVLIERERRTFHAVYAHQKRFCLPKK